MTTTYYTDHITGMPAGAIWRASLRANPLLCVPVFLYFMFRKMVGWRSPAKYGIAHPQELEQPSATEVPPDVHFAFARYRDAVLQAQCRCLFFLRSPYIGAKEGYSAVYLHENGVVWVTLVWFHLWSRNMDRSRVVLACHSKRATGGRLHTGPVPKDSYIPQLIPPTDELLILPIHTTTEEVIAQHLRRIEGEKDLIQFDAETLKRELVQSVQELIDFYIRKGFYTELTPAEVNRLLPDTYGE